MPIYHGAFLKRQPGIPFVDLIFADPPFNAGKVYGSGDHSDSLSDYDYKAWLRENIHGMADCLSDGGTLWLMNDTRWIGYCQTVLDDCQLTFLNMVVWVYTNPTPAKRRFSKTWRPILVYSRGPVRTWNQNAFPMEKPTLYYNPERREHGKPFVHDVWADVPKLVGGFLAQPELIKKESGQFAHLAQMPIALAERAILTATEPGDVVLDPFAGSGTALEAAAKHGRRWIGVEQEADYVEIIKFRMGKYEGEK